MRYVAHPALVYEFLDETNHAKVVARKSFPEMFSFEDGRDLEVLHTKLFGIPLDYGRQWWLAFAVLLRRTKSGVSHAKLIHAPLDHGGPWSVILLRTINIVFSIKPAAPVACSPIFNYVYTAGF